MPASSGTVSIQPPAPIAEAADWLLDPAIDFLNHGCFGARLRSVADAQQRYRAQFEARPVKWLDRERDAILEPPIKALSEILHMSPRDFGFVTNATDGVTAVLRSLKFEPGDELLTTSHVYNAIRNVMTYIAERAGGTYREFSLPLPIESEDQIVRAIESELSERSKLLVIDHITSPTAILFPIQRIIELAHARNIDVLVDGAHAPGMVELDVESIGAAYYTGNLHKWVCAPPGAAFLHVRPDRQDDVHPCVVSHFMNEGMAAEFSWQGTRDITPWLCVTDVIREMGNLPGGWRAVRQHNHDLAAWAHAMLCEKWRVEPISPLDGSMLGSMASITLPESLRTRDTTPDDLHDRLYDEFAIEAPIIECPDRWVLRISCQVYNRPAQYERLGDTILKLAAESA